MNKGIGAGGKKTVINGSLFEIKTSVEKKLLENNYKKKIMSKNKFGYYFENIYGSVKTIYLTQNGFKEYFKKYYNLDIYKQPDEAFIIISDDMLKIKILEKKNQNVEGSVEDKLKTGLFNKKEYEKMFLPILNIKLTVSYAFCVSKFLQNKFESDSIKYKIYKEIMNEDNIKLFYSDDKNYFNNLFDWIE